jgi:hypothetical protein
MKRGLTIGKVRSKLYSAAKLLGDVEAAEHHAILRRIVRITIGKKTNKIIRNFIPKIW